MTEPKFIRPSDQRPPEDYPEWLQADADFHRPLRWREPLARALTGLGTVIVVVALLGSLAAWRKFIEPAPAAFGYAESPVAP